MSSQDSWPEVLGRLRPLLESIFSAYEVSPQQAQEIVEEAGLALMSRLPPRRDPEGWLVRTVIERCARVKREREGKPGE
jgi:DNA-directed RNA polymerase specialized sigma24 family protein